MYAHGASSFSNQKASRDWCDPSLSRAFATQSNQRKRNVVQTKAAVVCVGRSVASAQKERLSRRLVESVRETKILALHTIKETEEMIIGLL